MSGLTPLGVDRLIKPTTTNAFPKITTTMYTLLVLLSLPRTVTWASNVIPQYPSMPGLSEETYSVQGDINIGAMISVKDPSGSANDVCVDTVMQSFWVVTNTEDIAFAVDVVNRDKSLLPNVTLGFIARDMCGSSKIALATSLSFLPRSRDSCNITSQTCHVDESRGAGDVIAVLAPSSSATTVPISTLYGVAHVPLMGHMTTSDELSDKYYHPYFFRVVPPDEYNVQALLKFIHKNRWSYISVLYASGSWGENAFDSMKLNVANYGICIATSHRLPYPSNYEAIVDDLLQHSRARVVVLFTYYGSFRNLLEATITRNATRHFIWLGTDGIARYPGYDYDDIDYDPAVGTFTFDLFTTYVPEFYEFLRNQTLATSRNPFLRRVWEYFFDCSFRNQTCDENASIMDSDKVYENLALSLKVDSVLAFAHATHNLLSDQCPGVRGQEARACITGELLRQYLRNVSFQGYSGHVQFDSNQDVRGKYIISQFVYGYYQLPFASDSTNDTRKKRIWKQHIGIYDILTDTITYFNETISWSHLNNMSRIVPWNDVDTEVGGISIDVPESVCSRPCLVFEYKIEKELPCCWECRKCRENERIVNENTSCETCPEFQWPDASTGYRTCSDIALTYPKPSHLLPIILICLAIVVIIVTVLIFIGYVIYRNERVVKAGSRELSLLQLVAIFVGYVTVLVFQAKPTDETCGAIYFMFSMSFAWLYSPLLVKTIRIYRIFTNSTKHNRRPRYVSPHSQLVMALCLIAVQVLLCVVTYSMSKPTAHRNQPIWSEKLVELSCDLTLVGLASFLSYNLILVCLCSIFAFKTRKLPDNFNESKFISMCVSTTLVIWLAFIPTYFTADREVVRVLLLSTALLLNHSVALLFLFVPKLYAAIFLAPEGQGQFNATRFQTSVSVFASSRVGPSTQGTVSGERF